MKLNILPSLTILPLLCLSSCSKTYSFIDDIDLAYYVHHINHHVMNYATKADVTIKQLGSNDRKTYTFEDLIWANENSEWTSLSDCTSYKNDGEPLGYMFTSNSIINDDIIRGFVNDQYWDIISAIDYYGDSKEEREEESLYFFRCARLMGNELTLINQWEVVSYLEKIEVEGDSEGDEESTRTEYVEPKLLRCVSKAIYDGEKLSKFGIYIVNKFYMFDDNQDMVMDYHEEVFDSPIDYLEYTVSF